MYSVGTYTPQSITTDSSFRKFRMSNLKLDIFILRVTSLTTHHYITPPPSGRSSHQGVCTICTIVRSSVVMNVEIQVLMVCAAHNLYKQ